MSQPLAKKPDHAVPADPSPTQPVSFFRLISAIAIGATLISYLAVVDGLGPVHLTVVVISLVLFGLVFCGLTHGSGPKRRRKMFALVALLALAAGAWASSPAPPTVATPAKGRHPPKAIHPEPPAIARLGQPIALGVRTRELAVTSDGLWALTNAGVAHFDPRAATNLPEAFAVPGTLSYLAADATHVVVVQRGWVSVYDSRSQSRIGDEVHFSEAPGPVVIAFGAAWLCNRTHSKLDRFDLRTHALTPINVPGVPLNLLVVGRSIWVTVEEGWLIRVDPARDSVVAHYRTELDPQSLAWGFGSLWISHPSLRRVTRVNPTNGEEIGSPIPVDPDIGALVTAAGGVWAISGSQDALQRIDPQRQVVTASLPLPPEPSGLVKFRSQLFITSSSTGTLIPITIEGHS